MENQQHQPVVYVIRSKSEGVPAGVSAFWTNDLGWSSNLREAARFSTKERMELWLPASCGSDAEWMLLEEAQDIAAWQFR